MNNNIFDILSQFSDRKWYTVLIPQRFDGTVTMQIRQSALAYYAALNEKLTPELFSICQDESCKNSGFAFFFARDIVGADIDKCREAFNPDNFKGWKKESAKFYNKLLITQLNYGG
jgi:hypothetical protein